MRQHVNASNLAPFTLLRRTARRTPSGQLVITEHSDLVEDEETNDGGANKDGQRSPFPEPKEGGDKTKSPVADMLYMRWMEGLRIRWPGS